MKQEFDQTTEALFRSCSFQQWSNELFLVVHVLGWHRSTKIFWRLTQK